MNIKSFFQNQLHLFNQHHFFSHLFKALSVTVALITISACAAGAKVKLNCLKENCTGKVTLATLDYSTAKCEANGKACEFQMPANHTFNDKPVSGQSCVKPGRCGRGDNCAAALKTAIKNAKWDLENKRKVLLAGANNRCVTAPSPNSFVCTWTDPTPLPDPKFVEDNPKATCTRNKCKCPQ
ncbi:MAG: hypothetical protein OQK04_02250 [Kangiellaceae bacterium]|nr:hypothetical protein [Kangiellaceae bacterium]MCW8997524.1 hypothetical protein [Kangiellaceae bacterium]